MDNVKAIILAGGKGRRLKPFTYVLPKPLVPVGEKPILEILLNQLKGYGIKDIVLCVNHMAELIRSYFGNGKKFGINIEYSVEDKELGTVGPLKLIKELPENFLVMNGDLLTDMDFMDFFNFHLKKGKLLSVSTYTRVVNIDFGVIKTENNKIYDFIEKPDYTFEVSMGVYGFNKKVLDYVPDNEFFGFDKLMLKLLGMEIDIESYNYRGYWLDIGRPEDFEIANEDIKKLRFIK